MRNWPVIADELAARGEPFVIVTVAATRGSVPRETGARMIVTADEVLGTIGGGQLEYQCTQIACRWFGSGTDPRAFVRRFTLGASLGQCCGGVVEAMFEQVDPARAQWTGAVRAARERNAPVVLATLALADGTSKFLIGLDDHDVPAPVLESAQSLLRGEQNWLHTSVALNDKLCVPALFEQLQVQPFDIVLFGAGHVGTALVEVLAPLDCRIRWIDSRPRVFPQALPRHVETLVSSDPEAEVARIARGSFVLVMTHSHPRDLSICAAALRRDDLAYCGLIGSVSKRRQFERRLRKLGLTDAELQRLVCPIGVGGIAGKQPAAIAIAVAAELLQRRDAALAAGTPRTQYRAKARR